MRHYFVSLLFGIFLVATALPAFANDSIARVGAGGITLSKTNQVAMVDEVLEISTKAVRVHYRFRNESAKDVQATVAFPMPPYRWNPGLSALDTNVGPLKEFRLVVNGQAVKMKSHRAAMIGTRDVTEQLRRIGLSEAQIFETFGGCYGDGNTFDCEITKDQQATVAKLSNKGETIP